MSFTNKTPNYDLPQYVAGDKPQFLTDLNDAFSTIDATMHENATAIAGYAGQFDAMGQAVDNATKTANDANSNAQSAQETASGARSIANNAVSIAQDVADTAEMSLINISKSEHPEIFTEYLIPEIIPAIHTLYIHQHYFPNLKLLTTEFALGKSRNISATLTQSILDDRGLYIFPIIKAKMKGTQINEILSYAGVNIKFVDDAAKSSYDYEELILTEYQNELWWGFRAPANSNTYDVKLGIVNYLVPNAPHILDGHFTNVQLLDWN